MIDKKREPVDLLICMDTSASTFGHVLQLMKESIYLMIDGLDENDRVSIVEFHK